MKEHKTCATCKHAEELPFVDTLTCMNEKSDFVECPCSPNDSCDEYEKK